MQNWKVTLAYDGTDFHGWQVQPGERTVQGELQAALGRVTGEAPLPQGSGRTDAGVHALGQVASFALQARIPASNLHRAVNRTLPAEIRILDAQVVPDSFHARHSARAKTYEYRVLLTEPGSAQICPPFLARYVWHYPYKLDEEGMGRAATSVVGEHDFTSFAAVDPERGHEDVAVSNVRKIFSSSWERRREELAYTVRGSGFLHHMVRNLVGPFILVGKGTLQIEDVPRILEARSRSAAGATAPASGLYLVSVEY